MYLTARHCQGILCDAMCLFHTGAFPINVAVVVVTVKLAIGTFIQESLKETNNLSEQLSGAFCRSED